MQEISISRTKFFNRAALILNKLYLSLQINSDLNIFNLTKLARFHDSENQLKVFALLSSGRQTLFVSHYFHIHARHSFVVYLHKNNYYGTSQKYIEVSTDIGKWLCR